MLLQRAQQQQQKQQQHVLLQHPVLLQYTLLQHPLPSSKYIASGSSDVSAAASHYISSSPQGERRCNFRSEDVPHLGLLHEVVPAVPSAGLTRAKTSSCLRRRDGKECLQRPRHAQKLVLYEAILHRISWATARAGPSKHVGGLMGTLDVVLVVAVVHHIS